MSTIMSEINYFQSQFYHNTTQSVSAIWWGNLSSRGNLLQGK